MGRYREKEQGKSPESTECATAIGLGCGMVLVLIIFGAVFIKIMNGIAWGQ